MFSMGVSLYQQKKDMRTQLITVDKYTVKVEELEGSRFAASALCLMATPKGKWSKEKVVFNYGYTSFEAALNKAVEFKKMTEERIQTNIERKEAIKVRNMAVDANDFYKVGDVVVNTWGYEQTNTEFYKVTRVLNRTIEVIQIGADICEGSMQSHGMACDIVPDVTTVLETTYKLRVKAEGALSNPQSYYSFHKWDGKPEYKSWYY